MVLSLNLEDLGSLLEGKVICMEEVWYLVDKKGKHHKLVDIFAKYENQDVRFTMADMETLGKLQTQLSKLVPGGIPGMDKDAIIAKLTGKDQ